MLQKNERVNKRRKRTKIKRKIHFRNLPWLWLEISVFGWNSILPFHIGLMISWHFELPRSTAELQKWSISRFRRLRELWSASIIPPDTLERWSAGLILNDQVSIELYRP